jgi:uncharacterized protein YjiS (DUF1127 family)
MRALEAIKILDAWDRKGRQVFRVEDLRKLMPESSEKTFVESVRRLVVQGLLERATNGIYINPRSTAPRTNLLEKIAVALRRGAWSYISAESALSEHGAISQIPVGLITVMTTGRSGRFDTPFGAIEFSHTSRAPEDIFEGTIETERPLRLAKPLTAWRDLQRMGRNLHMVSMSDLEEIGVPKDEIAAGRQRNVSLSASRQTREDPSP